ncbi:MAG: hypothetical protein ACI8UR_000878, partial [Natronomonas sp.]
SCEDERSEASACASGDAGTASSETDRRGVSK